MALLRISPLTATARVWSISKKHKTLIAEHSDLGSPQLYNRIYDDACDVGIALHNPKSGKTTTWYLADEISHEGDLEVWVFKPLNSEIRKFPNLAGWEVHILND